MRKLVLAIVMAACNQPDTQPLQESWAFNCPDHTLFVCRDSGYYHCDHDPAEDPDTSCTYVSAICTSNPLPGQSEAAAACWPTCNGTVTCTREPPHCSVGEVPVVVDGCYAETCLAITSCDVPPPCAALANETDCLARPDCEPDYKGLDCTSPTGESCEAGTNDCTCASFEFASCE